MLEGVAGGALQSPSLSCRSELSRGTKGLKASGGAGKIEGCSASTSARLVSGSVWKEKDPIRSIPIETIRVNPGRKVQKWHKMNYRATTSP